jgi:CelD/BcsL family acetyltransferase involved in cellulose biosynthesis
VDRSLVVTRAVPMAVAEWEAIDRRKPGPTFFARPAWAHSFVASYPGFSLAPVWCEFADGSRVFVPMVRSRGRLGWTEYFALPLDKYTAALESDGSLASVGRAQAAFTYVLMHLGHSCTLSPWPPAYGAIEIPTATGGVRETSLIDLSDGAEAAIARMDGKARRMAHQAEKRGVQCTLESASRAVIDEYYSMLSITASGWDRGTPTFPKRLLEEVVARGGTDVEIWFARFEDKPIAGGVAVYGEQELMFWSAAMLSEYSTLRPSNALNVALIRAAAARGVRWYNLGSSEGCSPGVKRFKDGLGAFGSAYTRFVRISPLYALYCNLRKRFVGRSYVSTA